MLRLIFHLVQDHLPQHIPEKNHKSVFDSIDFYRNQRSTCSYCWQPWLMFQWWFGWQDLSAPWMRELRQQILGIHNCLETFKEKTTMVWDFWNKQCNGFKTSLFKELELFHHLRARTGCWLQKRWRFFVRQEGCLKQFAARSSLRLCTFSFV